MKIRLRDEQGEAHDFKIVEDKTLGDVLFDILAAACVVGAVVLAVFLCGV